MSKINVAKIVEDTQKLYAKDKKALTLISTGDAVKASYKPEDLIILPKTHLLSALIGLPGIPFNKIIQASGSEDTGKSTLAYEVMVSAQQQGVQVILWDAEDKFVPHRFNSIGGDSSQILLIKTNEILKGGELVRKYITAVKEQDDKAKILLVWDSVGASQSRSHAERTLDDEKHAQPGQDAKENGSVMKTLIAVINKYPDSIVVYLANQTYSKIGFMQHGDAEAGGKKIAYHSSFIVRLKKIKTLTKVVKGTTVKTGIISRAIVAKNHLGQGETSIHQLDFLVTSKGSSLSEGVSEDEEE